MVRFSDIIAEKDKERPRKKPSDNTGVQEDSVLSNSQIARVLSDEQILKVKGKMSVLREHPKRSYEILSPMGERYHWLAEVALQVHE